MTEEARADWLAVAWQTLRHIPADILQSAAAKARQTCDHPSKIVPAIITESEWWVSFRRRYPPPETLIAGPSEPRSAGALMDARGQPMTEEEAGILNKHLEWLDSPWRYRTDGSRYSIEQAA